MTGVETSARVHEQARVASVRWSLAPAGGLALLRDRVTAQLGVIARWAEETGVLIGHVKAYIQWEESEALMLSTTGGAVECKGSALPARAPEEAEVGVTAIVFGCETEEAAARLEALASALLGQYGDWCAFHRETEHRHLEGEACDDPDCECRHEGSAHHHHHDHHEHRR